MTLEQFVAKYPTHSKAAHALGVTRMTLYRWRMHETVPTDYATVCRLRDLGVTVP